MENKINDKYVKIKLLNKKLIFPNDDIICENDNKKKKGKLKNIFKVNNSIKHKESKVSDYYKSNIFSDNKDNSSLYLKNLNNSKYDGKIDLSENNKTLITNVKYLNLKSLLNSSRKSVSNKFYIPKFVVNKKQNAIKTYKLDKIKKSLLNNRKNDSIKYHFSFKNIQRYNDYIKFEKINKANAFKDRMNTNEEISKLNFQNSMKNDFIQDKCGIYLYKNKYINQHYSFVKRYNTNIFFNHNINKKKNPTSDIFSNFNKIKSNLLEENKQMKKKIKSSYSKLKNEKNKINLKILKIQTPKEFRRIYSTYNKKRAEKEKILTNLYINESKNPKAELFDFKEKKEASKIVNENNLINLAENKINKLYHDLLVFKLPELDNSIYIRNILYDVFIEFKNMLLLSMMKNRDINIHKNGLDFESFYNCNTKINQQGGLVAKKLFKIFNKNSDDDYLSFENYVNGMIKLNNANKEKKLNLFFDMLVENSKDFMTYDDIYKFGIISLQKMTLNLETFNDFEKAKQEEKNKNNVEVIEKLADFFAKMIFELVNIDIKDNIPLELLKKMIIKGGEEADYIGFLFNSGNFV